jgi:hypothetical protein
VTQQFMCISDVLQESVVLRELHVNVCALYRKTLAVKCQMVSRPVNNELERIWK